MKKAPYPKRSELLRGKQKAKAGRAQEPATAGQGKQHLCTAARGAPDLKNQGSVPLVAPTLLLQEPHLMPLLLHESGKPALSPRPLASTGLPSHKGDLIDLGQVEAPRCECS